MNEILRKFGTDIVGNVPWGTHICQFYESKEELVDILVPYFKVGLENNEYCLWVTSQPLKIKDAKEALRKAVPDLDSYLDKGQIEIISYTCLHVNGNIYDSGKVINYWIEKLNHVLESGYSGLRMSENISWLKKKDWSYFVDYMGKMDDIISKYRMIKLDSHCINKYSITDIAEVFSNHQFSLSKKEGKWKKIDNLKLKKVEEVAFRAVRDWEQTFDAVPDLIAVIDTKFQIVRVNRAMAVKLKLPKEECVGLTCYRAIHGTSEPPSFCPHQQLVNNGLEQTAEIYENFLDGYFLVSVSPLHDSEGKLTGYIHVARNITEHKRVEMAIRRKDQRITRILENILSPARKIKNLVLADIIDVKVIRSLMIDFYKLANIPIGLNDLKGNVLVSVGWQDICTKFHRIHPEASKYCIESDTKLALVATPKELKMYKCKNNMWDIVTPLMLDGKHVGYVFSGQFFFDDEPLDYEFFRSQARKYDFNEEEYIAALNKVPRLSRKAVDTGMAFLMAFTNTLSQLSYSNFKQGQLLAERNALVNALQGAEKTLKKARDNLEKLVEERTKQLEKAYNSLKESEKRLAEAQKMSHIGHWEWDIITDKAYWSDELYRIFRRDSRELAPTYNEYLSYVHPKDRDHVDNALKRAINGKPYSIDHRIILANGEERTVHIQSEVIFDEKKIPIGVKGIVQDITERKKAEEKIQSLANIVESSNDAIITVSLDGIITSWNKGAEQIYGYSSEEILGKDVSIVAPENLKGETKKFIEKVKLGEKIQSYITSRLRKDGKLVYASIALSPVFDASGELVAISAIARDITQRIEGEKSLLKAEKAKKKEIHHRIKNNLQVISSLLDLQAEKFKNREWIKDSEVLEAFRESQDRVISMALIHEKLYKGDEFETLNFSAYIRELAKNLFQTYRINSKNIYLNMDMEENVSLNMDTAIPLGIVVNELVSNSLKHAFTGRDEGRIYINLRREENEEHINSREKSKSGSCKSTNFILKVSDDGVGLPESIDLENPNSLGMQLVTTLVDQLDGELELERNNETEFTIRFIVTKK